MRISDLSLLITGVTYYRPPSPLVASMLSFKQKLSKDAVAVDCFSLYSATSRPPFHVVFSFRK